MFFLIIIMCIKNFFAIGKIIDKNTAIELINRKNAVIFDIRSIKDYQNGHIVNAIHINLLNFEEIKKNILKKYKNHSIIIVSMTGYNINTFAKKLKMLEFKNIFVLKDGINGWKKNKLPLIKNKY
ncbi:rhodanese-like domain-containing protein [Candidatus Tachikawaea gelatinosa]|nr:rhodanese-like domain-containing protein [Candidatus Tachikawaea gelatinosa]